MSDIIAIISSPRTGCNSETIARAVAEGAEKKGNKVRFVHIKDLTLNPCKACNYCKKNDRCILRDEISELIESIRKCDGLILTSPLYFGQACAQYRVFEDRLYSGIGPNGSNIPPGKKVVSIVTCGSDGDDAQNQADHMNRVLEEYFGGVPIGTVTLKDMGDKDAASKDHAVLRRAKELGMMF